MSLAQRFGSICIGLVLGLAGFASHAEVVAVVSARSTITSLSKAQVADIFFGRVSRFPDGMAAVPIDQAEGSAARDEFYEKLAGRSPAQIKAFWSKIIFTGRGRPPKTVSSSTEVKQQLATNLLAIGYIEDTQVDPSVRVIR